MRDIFVNGKPIDLNSGVEQHRISSGCLMLDNPDPCKKHSCNTHHGRCMVQDAFRYKCQCSDGYGGQFCELGKYIAALLMDFEHGNFLTKMFDLKKFITQHQRAGKIRVDNT